MKLLYNVRCLVWAFSILILSSLDLVIPKYICLSNLPGLNIEGSSKSGRLVAPMIKIWLDDAKSICINNYATILSITWFESPLFPLLGIRASSSSIKTMQGFTALALSKICRTFFSLYPTYMFRSSGPLTLIKLILHSFAMHFPRRVFPVPGGP